MKYYESCKFLNQIMISEVKTVVRVVAKNYVKKDKVDEVIELCKELVQLTREEEGCIKYEMFQDEQDPCILTMIEEWESRDHLNSHFEADHFKRIVPMLGEFHEKETEVNIYNKII